MLKHRQMRKLGLYEYISNMYFYIFSSATLNETFTAKYTMAFCREHPKRDQNPKFTPLKGPPPPHPPRAWAPAILLRENIL